MNYLLYHEDKPRGSPDFPLEYYAIDQAHPRYEMPYHWHEEFELLRVISGTFPLAIDEITYPLHPGDVALIGAGCLHGGVPQGCVYECVVFDMRLLLAAGEAGKQYISDILHRSVTLQPIFAAGSPVSTVLPALFDALQKRAPGYQLCTLGCLMQFFGLAYQHGALAMHPLRPAVDCKKTLLLKQVFELIESQYHTPLSLSALAACVHMSPKYFCRFFKEVTRRTPLDYVNYYRIERACYAFAATDHSVAEVALMSGFTDPNYFARIFKRYKAVTPGQYAMRVRGI